MIGGERPKILDQSDCVGTKSPIFDLFARSDSAVTPSEKNFNYLSLRWTSYVVRKLPPKGGSKKQCPKFEQ